MVLWRRCMEAPEYPKGPLYRHSDFNDLTQYTAQVASMMLFEVRDDGEFSFLRDCEGYAAFLAKWSDD